MTLQLHSDASGLHHSLAGKPLRPGDVIEVLVNGQWVNVQYRWCGEADICPFGIIDMDATTVTLRADTHVRWPQE